MIDKIIECVSAATGVPREEILSRSRKCPIVDARRMAMALLYARHYSQPAIGRAFGCTHSTVNHHLRTHADETRLCPGGAYARMWARVQSGCA